MSIPSGYKNCWEYWHCTDDAKAKCPVYKEQDGHKCWLYLDNLDIYDWAKPKKEYHNCSDCPWYKMMHPHKVG